MNPIIKKLFTKAAMNNPQIASYQFFKEDSNGNMIPRDPDEMPEYYQYIPPTTEDNYDPLNPLDLDLV